MSVFLLAVLTGFLGLCVWKGLQLIQRYIANRRKFMKVQGAPHHPFWGHLQPHQLSIPLGESSLGFIMECCRSFDWRPFRMMLGPFRHAVAISHPDDLQVILKTEPKAEAIYSLLRPWLGDGLLIASGKLWSRNRRLLTPAFHFNVLKPYAAIYASCINTAMEVLAPFAKNGNPVEIFGVVSRMAVDILLQCALSHKSDCQTNREKTPYVRAILRVCELVMDRALSVAHQSDLIYAFSRNGREFRLLTKYVHDYAEKIIQTRRKALESNGNVVSSRYRDFIDILLEARDEKGMGMSNKEIRNEVDTFLFEGHDTTAGGITWTLYCLARHPEHQTRIRNEVKEVLSNGRTEFDWESLNLLTHTTLCIKESMRLFPPVPTIHRELANETKLRDYVLPKGQWIFVNIYGLQRNPEFWKDPEKFEPERMKDNRHPYAYVPFSAGPRNCIGQQFALNEERMAVAKIVNRYEIEVVEEHKFEQVVSVILKPLGGGLMLRFKERQN
ncbi:cytochrome P450 4A10-like [Oscarella lobularis]|uniref:cytochrome P450 4A10-like n=1 Tax=Oscarella lobularis TaxID=121494 RepID=UPI003313D791